MLSVRHGAAHARLQNADVESLIVTGAETEVCVLATVMGVIDLEYRVIIMRDAVRCGADSTHDAMMKVYRSRDASRDGKTADFIAARDAGSV